MSGTSRGGTSRAIACLTLAALLCGPLLSVVHPAPAPQLNARIVDVAPGWTNVTSSPSPPRMAGAMMAYSWKAQRFVLFGGWDGAVSLNHTWVYDPQNRTWTEVHPMVRPLGRGDGMLVYDGVADTFILFGGWHEQANETYERLGDTWFFSLANHTWTKRNPTVSPSARSDAQVAFDDVADVVLLVGGFNGAAYLSDVWCYSVGNDTWFPRKSAVSPSPRADGRMVYVDSQDRFILFGGNDFNGPNYTFHHLADTWSYDWKASVWTPLTNAVGPEARDYPVFAFNPAARLGLLTAGFGNGTILNDLWGFNITTDRWVDLTPKVSPPPRFAAVGGFDQAHDVLVIFSGLANTGLLADTWHYVYGALVATPGLLPVTVFIGVSFLAVAVVFHIVRRRRS